MGDIKDIHNPWRDRLKTARFRNALFHVEVGSRENGRRVVVHEFPKKELPYAEDMGRRAKMFSVRAYCITYPRNIGGFGGTLYNIDYRVTRDLLLTALEAIGPGMLQLPTLPAENVVCSRYRLTEEEKLGGYCLFDIEFAEFGLPPQYLTTSANTQGLVNSMADSVSSNAGSNAASTEIPT